MRAAAVKRLAARMTQIGDCRRPAVYGIMSLAGRDISVSHDALGTARVMRTGGMMGEVVGYAAKYCVRYGCDPRGVYESHLEEFIAELKARVAGQEATIREKRVTKSGSC